MTSTDTQFQGSIPNLYQRYLAALLFEPYAEDLVARLHEARPKDVLEVAAGTGVVTQALASALPAHTRIVATDLNQAMLDVAAQQVRASHVTFQRADAQQLPFEDASFDAVVCQFGVMFYPDKLAGHREARRVLRPKGRYVFSVWDRLERNPLSELVHDTVAALFPSDPPGFYRRVPFGFHDVLTIRTQLAAAGFARIEVDTVERTTHALSAEHAATGLLQGTPLRSEIEARDERGLARATQATAQAIEKAFGTGTIENRMSAHVVTAYRD
jgi:ubiquinone/menaquinone biosynthesis C-methylase UbiE